VAGLLSILGTPLAALARLTRARQEREPRADQEQSHTCFPSLTSVSKPNA